MNYLVLAVWEEADDFNCFAVSLGSTPQDTADRIVAEIREQWQRDYPDHFTVFRNGDDCPEYVARYYLNKDYQTIKG